MQNSVKIIAGPCAIENQQQVIDTAKCISSVGLKYIRGGAYKPRVSPHSFQGLGDEGIDILSNVAKEYNLSSVSEIIDEKTLAYSKDKIDCIQIGTRNMTNYSLLKAVGAQTKESKCPIVFKRGMSSKISEWLSAAEYIKSAGNSNIIMCERGIRTFEDSTRFTLDISSVAVLNKQSNYPVCVDVSHAAGNAYIVDSLACAALASGADAIMIEIHPNPSIAKCDGLQQINLEQFTDLVEKLKTIAASIGKEII